MQLFWYPKYTRQLFSSSQELYFGNPLGIFLSGDRIMAPFKYVFQENLAKCFCFIFIFLGAGGTIITNFERLVKGDWKPEGDEWLKMS